MNPKYVRTGQVLTAEDWNAHVVDNALKLQSRMDAIEAKTHAFWRSEPQPAPSMAALAATAAMASASQAKLTRRQLFSLWRKS